jgi:hypothetical protein
MVMIETRLLPRGNFSTKMRAPLDMGWPQTNCKNTVPWLWICLNFPANPNIAHLYTETFCLLFPKTILDICGHRTRSVELGIFLSVRPLL